MATASQGADSLPPRWTAVAVIGYDADAGDASRKRRLFDKQKEGKKRMRQFGKVRIPQQAFIAALKKDTD